MPRRLGEIAVIDVDEIEEGDIRRNCRHCGKKQTRIIRNGTRNVWGACENPECFRFVDLTKVDTWTLEQLSVFPPCGLDALKEIYKEMKAEGKTLYD